MSSNILKIFWKKFVRRGQVLQFSVLRGVVGGEDFRTTGRKGDPDRAGDRHDRHGG